MNEKIFNEKQKRFSDALTLKEPDIVPIYPIIEQWANYATGTSIVDSYTKDPQILIDCFDKILSEVYVDALYGTGNLKSVKLLNTLGSSMYVINEDGVMIKGGSGAKMNDDEYPLLIADPEKFIMDKIMPRKYPSLTDEDQAVDLWHQGLHDVMEWAQYNKTVNAGIMDKHSVPFVVKAATNLAPDIILDYFRDFVGMMTDLRRRPQEVIDACEALAPMLAQAATNGWKNADDTGVCFIPLHLATYLKPKDFAKFYLPSMRRMVGDLGKVNMPTMYFCENDWVPYLDYLQDMPEGRILGAFEKGDLKKIKDTIGNRFCIMGGLKLQTLKMGSVQDCIDDAKWCLDNLAPGGGYIFGTDVNLCYRNDAKKENLIAACKYVHENGVY